MPATGHDQLENQLIDNRFKLLRRIGSGGMSVVYMAERVGMGKPLAIKFLRSAFANLPGFVRRFEQEAQACSRLNHLNCVSVLDYGVAFGSPYLVMEYIGGTPLSALTNKGAIEATRAIHIVRQILAGLRHAHARGVVHRDLKPGNVMLAEMTGTADYVKIMDFGTAQILTGDGADQGQSGTDIGTPWYMAPEQAAGQPTDPRTDVYAVGVMLFELLTGERPFVADDPMRVLQMQLTSPIPSVRVLRPQAGISPELEAVVVKAMQKQPDDRFESAEEFEETLKVVPEVAPRRIKRPTGPVHPALAPPKPRPSAPLAPLEPVIGDDELSAPPVLLAPPVEGSAKGKRAMLIGVVLALLAVGLGVLALKIAGVF
ncbi:MAG: serine/threonine protein kinase [Myxococcales bacterium]|nr:serine/threonine protein kinase [Myxococcales bacterium]